MVLRALGFALSLILAVAIAPFCAAQVAGPSLPVPLGEGVSDYADVLDATAEARIQRLIEQTFSDTGVEVRVVTMADIAAYGGAGTRLDAYAKALFNDWGVGDADRNDGILILVVTGAREARIALGAGYDAVYDGRAARVLSTAVLPDLRNGQIAKAIEGGLFSVRDRLITPFLSGQPVSVTDGFETNSDSFENMVGFAAFSGIAGLVIFRFFYTRRKRKTCPKCHAQTLTRRREVIEAPSTGSNGTGLEHMLCSNCGFTDRRTYTVGRLGLRRVSSDNDDVLHDARPQRSAQKSGFQPSGRGKSSGGGAGGRF